MLATVASLTSANRIKRRASESGISTVVIQTPQALAKEGCGYSLRFDDGAKNYVYSAAAELGIKIRAFYLESVVDEKKHYSKI